MATLLVLSERVGGCLPLSRAVSHSASQLVLVLRVRRKGGVFILDVDLSMHKL